MQSTLTGDAREFRAPQTMTPDELGDSLARLVWESFSDFLAQEDVETPMPEDTLNDADGTARRTAEEALIFFMWAHTRGAQLAFMGRAPDERIRQGLDAMHSAVIRMADLLIVAFPCGRLRMIAIEYRTRGSGPATIDRKGENDGTEISLDR